MRLKSKLSPNSTGPGTKLSRRKVLAAGAALGGLAIAGAGIAVSSRSNASSQSPDKPVQIVPRFRRGGSIHTMMNWADLQPGSKDTFSWPPFARNHFDIPPHFLKQLAATGIDFIRLTVDQGPFLQAEGEQETRLDNILLHKCRTILAAGLNLIVDIHPVNQVEKYTPVRITSDINSTLFKQYATMVSHVAEVLKELDPKRVAFEPFNEPPWGYRQATIDRWQKMMEIMHAGIRSNNPDITVIWSGAKSADITGLTAVHPERFADDNIIWTFHYYTPHIFTHQGVRTSQGNMLYYRYLSDLPYPASAGNAYLAKNIIAQNIMIDTAFKPSKRKELQLLATKAVQKYIDSGREPDHIAKDFDIASAWAARNNIPASRIFLGEFGVVRRSRDGNGPVLIST